MTLHEDGENPNIMKPEDKKRLQESMKKFGFLVPIITNQDLLIADGAQRLDAAKKIGLLRVPIIRLPVKEVDRRLLRQVMNKLRGEHDLNLDAHEIEKIRQLGGESELHTLIAIEAKMMEFYKQVAEPTIEAPIREDYSGIDRPFRWATKQTNDKVVAFGNYSAFVHGSTIEKIIAKFQKDEEKTQQNKDFVIRAWAHHFVEEEMPDDY